MARYGIALGGDKRNFPEWDNLYASGNGAGFIHYASHLMARHKVLPFNFDHDHPNWQSWLKQEVAGAALVVNDIVDVMWINPGTLVEHIAIHKKKLSGAPCVVTVRLRDNTGATIGTDFDVDLGSTAPAGVTYHVQGISAIFQKPGSVQLLLKTGSLEHTCFSVFTSLVNFHSEHGCSCDVEVCEVPTPTPTCFNSIR
ncbi:MAG: hypothetical protein ACRC8U_09750 [Brooklawnia sp.]